MSDEPKYKWHAVGVDGHSEKMGSDFLYTSNDAPIEADEYERMKTRAEAAEHKLNDVLPQYVAQCAKLLEDNDALRQRAEQAEAQLASGTKRASPTEVDELTLSNLQEDTNDVLDSLDKNLVKGAINWADLRCVSVEKVHDKRGREWFRVEIEEAAPGEEALIAAVAAGLTAKGWYMPDIEIAAEW